MSKRNSGCQSESAVYRKPIFIRKYILFKIEKYDEKMKEFLENLSHKSKVSYFVKKCMWFSGTINVYSVQSSGFLCTWTLDVSE